VHRVPPTVAAFDTPRLGRVGLVLLGATNRLMARSCPIERDQLLRAADAVVADTAVGVLRDAVERDGTLADVISSSLFVPPLVSYPMPNVCSDLRRVPVASTRFRAVLLGSWLPGAGVEEAAVSVVGRGSGFG
jgi:hypothetical protein